MHTLKKGVGLPSRRVNHQSQQASGEGGGGGGEGEGPKVWSVRPRGGLPRAPQGARGGGYGRARRLGSILRFLDSDGPAPFFFFFLEGPRGGRHWNRMILRKAQAAKNTLLDLFVFYVFVFYFCL